MTRGSDIVCSGSIKSSTNPIKIITKSINTGPVLCREDFYTELKLRGYEVLDKFKLVSNACFQGTHGSLQWDDNWITFLDNMVQVFVIGFDTRAIYLPKSMKKLLIRSSQNNSKTINIKCCRTQNSISSPFVEIYGLQLKKVFKQGKSNSSFLQAQMFVPLSFSQMSTQNAASVVVQLYLESRKNHFLRILEVESSNDNVIQTFQKVVADIPLLKASLYLQTDAETLHQDIEKVRGPAGLYDIIITDKIQRDHLESLTEGGYLILKTRQNKFDFQELHQISTISLHDSDSYFLVLMKKTRNFSQEENIDHISPSEDNDWIEKAKSSDENLISMKSSDTLHCVKIIQSFHGNKTFFISKEKLSRDRYVRQLSLALSVNVFEQVRTKKGFGDCVPRA